MAMKPGDIALYRPHNTVGSLIGWFDNARYCHVRLIVDTRGSTVEADFKGAIHGAIQDGDVIVTAPLTDAQRALIPVIADGLIGTPYGFADLAALAAAKLRIPVPFLKKRLGRPDRLFCSQLVDVVWSATGFVAFDDGRMPQDVTPGDIADHALINDWPAHTYTAAQ